MNIIFAGFGDIAGRTAQTLTQILDKYTLHGIARSDKPTPDGVQLIRGAISAPKIQARLAQEQCDIAIVTLTPSARDPISYQKAYVDNCQSLIHAWQDNSPKHVIYVSSSGVYSQDSAQWINEDSPVCAADYRSQILHEAETIISQGSFDSTIVRFSGIYGPKRDFLIRQVKAGNAGGENYTNRIHEDDCAGFLAHLVLKIKQNENIEPIYIASDSEPEKSRIVRQWLAQHLNVKLNQVAPEQTSGKRLNNRLMLNSGYVLSHPNYKSGYLSILAKSEEQDRYD